MSNTTLPGCGEVWQPCYPTADMIETVDGSTHVSITEAIARIRELQAALLRIEESTVLEENPEDAPLLAQLRKALGRQP